MSIKIQIALIFSSIGLAGCMTSSAPAGDTPPIHAMVTTTAIVITNSGATNLIGYRIVVGTDGAARWASGDGSGAGRLPDDIFSKLKFDVVMAQPLSHMRVTPGCMKSVSFGTSTFVALGDEKSPDLGCTASDRGKAILADTAAVTAALQVRNVPRSEGHELPPQNF